MFLPHFTLIHEEKQSPPSQWILVLHGIYGQGGNWRTFARKLTTVRPDWGVILVDLRMHGGSLNAPPPHSLATCAADVLALRNILGTAGKQVGCVLGHSFGGKVALEALALGLSIPSMWVIDSSPSAQPGGLQDPSKTVVAVLRSLQRMPKYFESRRHFIEKICAQGHPESLGQWLAMNLQNDRESKRGLTSTLNTQAMESLLNDYFDRDLWDVVLRESTSIHVAMASCGSAISAQDHLRFLQCANVDLHEVKGGHWLHVDALDSLVALVAGSLSASPVSPHPVSPHPG